MAGQVVSIEGSIGVGKSSVKRELQRLVESDSRLRERVSFVDEPVTAWEAYAGDDGKGMIEMFYADPERWALAFQTMAYSTRLDALRKARIENRHGLLVCERSLAADRHAFAKMLADDGTMKAVEHKVYEAMVEASDAAAFAPDLVFHLTVPNDVAMSRIASRSRAGESAIAADYNEKLATYTADWVSTLASGTVVELDVTADGPEAVRKTAQKVFQELQRIADVGYLFGDWSEVADVLAAGC
jgi:deoxyadenosine/deoxycytidine kinase